MSNDDNPGRNNLGKGHLGRHSLGGGDCPSCNDHPMGQPVSGQNDVFAGPYVAPSKAELVASEQFIKSASQVHSTREDRAGTTLLRRSAELESPGKIIAPATSIAPHQAWPTRKEMVPGYASSTLTTRRVDNRLADTVVEDADGSVEYLGPGPAAPWHFLQRDTSELPDEPRPEPPEEPASVEDCEEWAKKFLKWLEENGNLVAEEKIEVICGNITYQFYRFGRDPFGWSKKIVTLRQQVMEDILDQLGDPAPSDEWEDPTNPDDFDEYWRNPANEVERDDNGEIIKKVLGDAEDCGKLKMRIVEHLEWPVLHELLITKEYIVADDNGEANQGDIEQLRQKQHGALEEHLDAISGARMEPAMPSQEALLENLESRFLIHFIIRKYFKCERPCVLRFDVAGWENLKVRQAPEEPLPEKQRISAKTEVVDQNKQNGYWKVEMSSEAKVYITAEADVKIDVWCEAP